MKFLISFSSCLIFGIQAFAAIDSKIFLEKLSNNAPIEIVEDQSSPRQSLVLVFHGGSGALPKNLQGLTSILSQMLAEGPKGMSGDEFRRQLFLLNSSINVSSGSRATYVSITAPVDNLKRILDLTYNVLQKPKLDLETFQLAQGKVLVSSRSMLDNMRGTTFYYGFRDAFKFHPDVLDGSAAPGTIEALKLDVAKEWFPQLINFRKMMVSTVGPATKWKILADMQTMMAKTKKQLGKNDYLPQSYTSMRVTDFTPNSLQVTIIHKPKATDNQVLYIFPEQLSFDSKERLVALVTHENLGGGLTGKLGDVLRTQRGLTYHASTRPDGQRPYWVIYTFGGIFQTEGLLRGIPEVINQFKTAKLNPKEIDLSKRMNQTAFRSGMELPEDRLFSRLRLKLYGLDPNFVDRFEDLLNQVTVEDVDAFRKSRLNIEKGFLYLMGDQGQILPVLKKMGIEKDKVKVVELTELI